MAISSYGAPTRGLKQLKFVKVKFSLETPTMVISSHSTPTGRLNQLKFVKIKSSLEIPTMAKPALTARLQDA